MKLKALLSQLHYHNYFGDVNLLEQEITNLCYSTKSVTTQTIFFALKGRTVDGSQFIPQAYAQGARVFVSETKIDIPEDALLILVENGRLALSEASHIFFGKPSEQLRVVGITGTKGKTTTTTLLYKVLSQSGVSAGVIGTNGIYYGEEFIPTQNTTPESYEIHRAFRLMVNAGIKVCFIEVSSQGLMMQRVEHVHFDLAVFTNMALDHIGELEHPTFENYLYWKTHLFSLAKTGLVNSDDAYVSEFMQSKQVTYYTYGIDRPADFKANQIEYIFNSSQIGMKFLLEHKENLMVQLPVPGKFNVYNALVVLAVAELLNVNKLAVIANLRMTTVPGRMEIIPNNEGVLAVLDYAHNGFSLQNVVETLQHYTYKRLLILFGSVGDRSQTRRKELGDVVAQYADIAMITSDNPGKEDPQAIIDEIAQSFVNSSCQVYQEVDRAQAIKKIIALANEGDIIIFAGKGHETYQLIGTEKQPFHEKELIQSAFANK